jgi:O-antigen ligase
MAQSDQSLELREALFEQGVQAFLSNPWFGGGYQAARSIRWPPELQQFADAQTMATTNTHLQWLEMLVSYGVLGGLLFTAMWLLSGWLVLQASTQSSGVQRLAGVLLFFNWMSLTIASFTTVYRESEWALWIMTLLAAFSLLQHKPKASASKHADIVTG